MQFSFVPWQYDEEVVRISREYVRIHEEIVTPIVLMAAKDVPTAGIYIYMKSPNNEPARHGYCPL